MCPRCQRETPPDARFCPQCGARLARAAWSRAERRPVAAAPHAHTPSELAELLRAGGSGRDGERKHVTVLFADLKSSMELLADRDPEEAQKLLDPLLEYMMDAVHRYEGTVNQVMGDGIMALFGAPLAHEDHAVRACYAALRMQEAVTRYGDEVQRTHGVPLQIRVGLNSGEAVVRAIGSELHTNYAAVGQTVHLAARMEQMAKPGLHPRRRRYRAPGPRMGGREPAGSGAWCAGSRRRWRSTRSWARPPRARACRPRRRGD